MVKTPFYELETNLMFYEWTNTNKLLGCDDDEEDACEPFKGTLGCKTGITQSAGPCFSGCFTRKKKTHPTRDNCIVVVLGSKSMGARWVEVPALVKYY